VRLVPHTAAFWLMHGVRAAIPRTSPLAGAEFATIRELIKIGARVSCPEAALFAAGRCAPTSRRLRQINPNALHSERHHTDPAGRNCRLSVQHTCENASLHAFLRLMPLDRVLPLQVDDGPQERGA